MPTTYKLGKRAPKIDRRTFKLAKYLPKVVPAPPGSMGYIERVKSWPMFLNDSIGDCTCAAAAHMIQQWATYAGGPFAVVDHDVLVAYMAVSGYNPNDPWTDQGAFMLDVLNYWRKVGIGGHKILGYAAVDIRNRTEVEQAIDLFGSLYVGVAMPVSAQSPRIGGNGHAVWEVPANGPEGDGSPGSWGGHAIPLPGYNADTTGKKGKMAVSWGDLYDVTDNFLEAYCDEAYAVLSMDWIESTGLSPSHFDLEQLKADLAQL